MHSRVWVFCIPFTWVLLTFHLSSVQPCHSIVLSRSWGRMIDEGDIPYHDTALKNSKDLNSTTSALKGRDNISTRGTLNKTHLKNVHTLAPAADMPNHDSQGHQAAKAPDGSLVLRAGTAVSPGEQVCTPSKHVNPDG